MANKTPFVLSQDSHDAFIKYYQEAVLLCNDMSSSQRSRFTEIDKAYQRETNTNDEHTQAKLQNKAGNPDPLQDITVPIVKPQVESSVVYQSSVFLTGVPIFGVVSNSEYINEALQLETTLDNHAIRGGWVMEFMKFFRKGEKYNFSPLEVSWDSETTVDLSTDAEFSTSEGKPTQVVWSGNKAKSLDPYNTFVDPRVFPSKVYKDGEFAGYTEFVSRIKLKQDISEMSDTQNVTKAFESSYLGNPTIGTEIDAGRYFVPGVNLDVSTTDNYDQKMNWLSWAEMSAASDSNKAIQYKNAYEKTILYCKILPSEMKLRVPGANTPQIWKLIIINHSVIIHAERQTNAHGYLPILIGVPNDDDLGYQTKSLAEDAKPFQSVSTSLMTSIIASRRRAISDRVLYDPSRIASAHINSSNPAAKIPVRPSASGKQLSESVYQFPYREDQAQFSIQQIKDVIGMANTLNGQNPARQGQFVKGNKTKQEFQDVMSNASGTDQLKAMLYESQVFTPFKLMVKLNILQYQGSSIEYSREKETAVQIDPIALRKAVLEFKISDGLVPSDKIIDGEAWSVAMQVIGSSPQIGAGYKIAQMFSYLMKLKGADLRAFEKSPEQQAFEQAMAQWQQIATMVAEKGGDLKSIPPQPLPEKYGYDPTGKKTQEQKQQAQLPATTPSSSPTT